MRGTDATIPKRCFIGSNRSRPSIYRQTLVVVFIFLSRLNATGAEEYLNRTWYNRKLLSDTQTYTNIASSSFTVPPGVTSITATLAGGNGATVGTSDGLEFGYGGKGGIITVTIPVTPGEVLQVNVAGDGGISGPGFNGGGAGCTENPNEPSGGGGGATDIRRSPYGMNNRLVVAGGGGGGSSADSASGGNGGYPSGESGSAGTGTASIPTGGTDTSGGTVASPAGCIAAGSSGFGGSCCNGYGGGGGAGYYGGASSFRAGGGGGSSFVDTLSGVQLVSHGISAGPSLVSLEYVNLDPTAEPTADPSIIPTPFPTSQPSSQPSTQPFTLPSTQPSSQPSRHPSTQPSSQPSVQPSAQPVSNPTMQPSARPSSQPSAQPSSQPTTLPTTQPSAVPSSQPSEQPSTQPSNQPSATPTTQPTLRPSSQPTNQPSVQPSSLPSVQPTGQPSNQPTTSPSLQPSSTPSGAPSSTPSTQPTNQPTTAPSGQPSNIPTSQPLTNPTSQPSAAPTTVPTELQTRREYAWMMSGNNTFDWSNIAYLSGADWGCGAENSHSACVLLELSGKLRTKYQFQWNAITSVVQTNDLTSVILSGLLFTENLVTTDIAGCVISATQLQCTAKSFLDTSYVAGSFAPSVDKLVYVGTSSGLASVAILRNGISSAVNYRYSTSSGLAIELTHVLSPPNYLGSFVAGTCTTIGSQTYIFAAMVRTDSGSMTAMYVSPVSGSIINSAKLVNAMALEYTQPDMFIGGALQLTGDASAHAYLVCVNALYQSVRYGRRYRISTLTSPTTAPTTAPSSSTSVGTGSDRRKLVDTFISNSEVAGLAIVEAALFVMVSWISYNAGIATNRISVLKTDINTGAIVQQAHILSHNASLYCTNMNSDGLFLTLGCKVQYSEDSTRPMILSVDKELTFSQLPVGFVPYENEVFSAQNVAFQRTKVTLSVDSVVPPTIEYTFGTMDGMPTAQPTVAATSKPSPQPSGVPSSQPSSSPSAAPSVSPQPTSQPSTSGPTNTYKPTVKPTLRPTPAPTNAPTQSPTREPTIIPTARPTVQPSRHPSTQPSESPTFAPTRAPQSKPTHKPSLSPTTKPTLAPSVEIVTGGAILPPPGSGNNNNGYNETVYILLYVLGSLTGAWLLYQMYQFYVQLIDYFAWNQKMRAHLKAVKKSLADQPSRIPTLQRREAMYKKNNESGLQTPNNAKNNATNGDPVDDAPAFRGAYANSTIILPKTSESFTGGANAESNSASRRTDFNCTPIEEYATKNGPGSVSSSSSSSLVLSSLHSSEMSEASYMIGKSKERV